MSDFEIGEIRKFTKMLAPTADFDAVLSFYYDETNNIRKFYVRETDFNSSFIANFVLGGLVHEGEAPDVTSLIESFKLQKTTKEVKFKHIAKGDFLNCLKSEKLKLFLQFIKGSKLYVHYSNLNILYWAIVDIVDSAIANSEVRSVHEITSTTSLFFCPSSALWQQLHSLLCAYYHALKTNKKTYAS